MLFRSRMKLILALLFLASGVLRSQDLAFRFQDGSEVIRPISAVRSVRLVDESMHVSFWDGSEFSNLISSSIVHIVTDFPESNPPFPAMRAFPNPAQREVSIMISSHVLGPIRVEVYNSLGVLMRVLHEGVMAKGQFKLTWDCTDGRVRVPAGTYSCRLVQNDIISATRIIVIP